MKRILMILGVVLLFGTSSLKAQVDLLEAKAKFIYNFTKFFEWPQTERVGDFVIGVLGSGNMYSEMEKFAQGKMVASQNIVVKSSKTPKRLLTVTFYSYLRSKQKI